MKKNDKNIKNKMINHGTVAINRKAGYSYELGETIEAGLQLQGMEVKSLRMGRVSIKEAYGKHKNGEIYVHGLKITPFQNSSFDEIDELRPKKLLLHKKQVAKLIGTLEQPGTAILPTKIYFNNKGLAKLTIAVGTGKTKIDKRQTIKEREWKVEQGRLMRKKDG